MLLINCQGDPYQIGEQHGQTARLQVLNSIEFYKRLFRENARLSWPQVHAEALKFLPYLEQSWSSYVEEMKGLANGASVDFTSVLALNVRTEIAYGLFNDGCTALSWKEGELSFLAQNWDWDNEQKPNIVRLRIVQPDKPRIDMLTEAGIIGKIGLNSAGVGVTLNAIKAKGVSYTKLPCHLALRTVLDSSSREAGRTKLQHAGVAAACHITIADRTGGIGLECSAGDIVELPMDSAGICTHSNHFVEKHRTIDSKLYLPDSPFRLQRVRELIRNCGDAGRRPSMEGIVEILCDEENFPAAICRAATEKSPIESLFSIVMDLRAGHARVKMGRPTEVGGEEFTLRP